MMLSKSLILAATIFAFVILASAESNQQQQQLQANNHTTPEMAATNPKLRIPILNADTNKTSIIAPSTPEYPGNLGINGTRWGTTLLQQLEGLLAGLIGRIPLPLDYNSNKMVAQIPINLSSRKI